MNITEQKPSIKLSRPIRKDHYEMLLQNRPWEALEIAPTHEDFEIAIKTLAQAPVYDNERAEALITALLKGDYTYEARRTALEWYGCASASRGLDRSDMNIMRAFRFLVDLRRSELTDDILNKMVKRHNWLYWCHKDYQARVVNDLRWFADGKNEHHWPGAERAIRRIVSAGDWEQLERIRQYQEFCHQLDPKTFDDLFMSGKIKALLEDAILFLGKRKSDDLSRHPHEFALTLRQQGDLRSEVNIKVDRPHKIQQSSIDDTSVFRISIEVADPSEAEKLREVLKYSSVSLTIEGGYIPGERGNLRSVWRKMESMNAWEVNFVPFVGRSRLWLMLQFKNEHSVTIPYPIETIATLRPPM